MPDQATVRRALERAEFVVRAGGLRHHRHLRLRRPAAAGHHLGREGRHRHQQRAPHQPRARGRAGARRGARTTGRIAVDVRAPAGSSALPARRRAWRARCSPTTAPRAIWNEHRESTRGRDLDITGLSYAVLEHAAAVAVAPKAPTQGTPAPVRRRPLPHRRRPRPLRRPAWQPAGRAARRALPVVADHRPAARPVARHEPHRHAGPAVRPRAPSPCCEMHPQDMARRALERRRPGARAARAAARSCCRCSASDAVAAGAGLHRHALGRGVPAAGHTGVNALTTSRLLPAVEAARAEARGGEAWSGRAALAAGGRRLAAAGARRWRCANGCAACSRRFGYCSVRALRPRAAAAACGLLFRARRPQAELRRALAEVEAALRPARRRGAALCRRAARPAPRHAPATRDGSLQAFLLAGDTAAQGWVLELLQQAQPAARLRPRAAGRAAAQPPQPVAPRSRQVCTCLDVSEDAIVGRLRAMRGDAAPAPGSSCRPRLRCGTECGSCLPALKAAGAAASDPQEALTP